MTDRCKLSSPPVGAVLEAKSERLMPPAYKNHTCVTWSPKCLQIEKQCDTKSKREKEQNIMRILEECKH